MASPARPVEDPAAAGRDALAHGRWTEARAHFAAAIDASGRPEAWEGLSWAAWWLSEETTTLEARERAYRGYRAAGDRCGAARAAIWLASDLLDFRGEDAPAAGWLERAARLLDGRPPCSEHGWLWLIQADLLMRTGAVTSDVERLAREARALGHELGVVDLESVGLALEGITLVGRGEVEDGMRRLAEASAIAAGDDFELALSPGWTLCCVVSACEGVGDFPRAGQWCRSMLALAERWGGRNLMGVCRSVYGSVLATGGDWPAAEAVLIAAVDDLEASRPAMAPSALVRLAELRVRQGREEDARTLFERAGPHPLAMVGLGRLALELGDPRAGCDAAERVLRRLPPSVLLDRLPALELLVRARAALGALDEAQAAAEELDRTAARLGTPYLRGRADLVRGELAVARGDDEAARTACEDAIDHLTAGSAPYEVARARLVLARALSALGREEPAALEARAAREAFTALGATRDADSAEAALAAPEVRGARLLGELTPRELDVLGLVAQGLSDAEIAERLVVSPHTVHRHVANVRTKLRLPSRSAAVAYAARAGLL